MPALSESQQVTMVNENPTMLAMTEAARARTHHFRVSSAVWRIVRMDWISISTSRTRSSSPGVDATIEPRRHWSISLTESATAPTARRISAILSGGMLILRLC